MGRSCRHVQQSIQMFRCVQYWYNGCGGTMNMFSNQFKCIQTCPQSDPEILEIYVPSDVAIENLLEKDQLLDLPIEDKTFRRKLLLGCMFITTPDLSLGCMFTSTSDLSLGCMFTLTPDLSLGCMFTLTPDLSLGCMFTLTPDLSVGCMFITTPEGVGCMFITTPDLSLGCMFTSTSDLSLGCMFTLTPDLSLGCMFTLTPDLSVGCMFTPTPEGLVSLNPDSSSTPNQSLIIETIAVGKMIIRLTDEVLGLTKADLKAAERSHKVAEMRRYKLQRREDGNTEARKEDVELRDQLEEDEHPGLKEQSSLRKFEEVGIAQQKNEDPFSPKGIEEASFSRGKEVVYSANFEEEDAISAIVPSVINESGKGSEGIDNSEQAPREINESELVSEGVDNSELVPGGIKVSKLVSEGMDNFAQASRDINEGGIDNLTLAPGEIDVEELVSEGMDNSTLAPKEINEEELVSEGVDNSELAPREINESELVFEGVDNSELAPREINESELVFEGVDNSAQAPREINEEELVSEGVDNSELAPREINESELVSKGVDNSAQAPKEINEEEIVSEGVNNSTLAPREINVEELVSEGLDNSTLAPREINEEELVSEGMDNSTLAPREINVEELVSEGLDNSTLAPSEINEEELVSDGLANSTLAPREINVEELVSDGLANSTLAPSEINEKELVAQGTKSTTVLASINVDAVSKKDKFNKVGTDETSEENIDLTKVGKDHAFKDISIVGEEVNNSQLTEKGKHGVDEEPIISESDGDVPCDVDRTYKNLESFDFQALTSDEEQKILQVLGRRHLDFISSSNVVANDLQKRAKTIFIPERVDRFESFIKGRPHLSRRAQLCSTVKGNHLFEYITPKHNQDLTSLCNLRLSVQLKNCTTILEIEEEGIKRKVELKSVLEMPKTTIWTYSGDTILEFLNLDSCTL
ncbi:uncharacterized protein LOC111714489 [Eurytemora carolleeae]|uniref:uncharacterized protein LOC111714489 n=1 Tax=Eurytemora carolleeae TaxID=1294199 RepID=UPI000C785933|nr:uncharacterized protein LOC111714489 [Eurytemora carolleeae]|eukprot:XP_023345383.1 uncharacterized protein LOC111714489 [Eurytemora affinis]